MKARVRAMQPEDEIANALSTMAHSVEKVDRSLAHKFGTRRSRFWFTVKTTKQVVAEQKVKNAPKTVEHIDHEVETRLKSYKKEMPPLLKGNIDSIREFFLTEIAPLTLAASGGTTQSKEVVQRLLETKVDSAMMSRFEQMVNRAAVLKMGRFVTTYFDLPDECLSTILGLTQKSEASELQKVLDALKEMASKDDTKNLPMGEVQAMKKKFNALDKQVNDLSKRTKGMR